MVFEVLFVLLLIYGLFIWVNGIDVFNCLIFDYEFGFGLGIEIYDVLFSMWVMLLMIVVGLFDKLCFVLVYVIMFDLYDWDWIWLMKGVCN